MMWVQVKEVALTMAGMEIGRALNVDTALAMNVFANIETFTKNMYRDTLNQFIMNQQTWNWYKQEQK